MTFWIVALLIMGSVAGWLMLALGRGSNSALTGAASDLAVYRDQLAEVDRDLDKGALTGAEAEMVRLEVSRRLLEADQRTKAANSVAAGAGWIARLVVVTVTLVGGTGLYLAFGALGAADLPMENRLARLEEAAANRMGQLEAEVQAADSLPQAPEPVPEFLTLMDKLRAALQDRPNDIPGLTLLARNEARLGNYVAAREAQDRLIAAKREDVTAEDYANGVEMAVFAAGGYISPKAEAYLTLLLDIEPRHAPARYFQGLLHVQNGRPDQAFPIWRHLLEDGPVDAPWVPVIRSEISAIAAAAGVTYAPPAPPGPNIQDRAAAAEMSETDRQDMIRGMVEGLAKRLGTEGGPPEDWARLITALGVLGQTARAQAIFDEAREVFTGESAALAPIIAAGLNAGLSE